MRRGGRQARLNLRRDSPAQIANWLHGFLQRKAGRDRMVVAVQPNGDIAYGARHKDAVARILKEPDAADWTIGTYTPATPATTICTDLEEWLCQNPAQPPTPAP